MFRGSEKDVTAKLIEEIDIYYDIEGLHSPLYIEPKKSKKRPALLSALQKVLTF